MININDCIPFRSGEHSVFTSKENSCTHIGNNPNHYYIRQYKIDGDVIGKDSTEERCDYLLLNDAVSTPKAYFIELKGSDIPKAISQIEATIAKIKPSISDYTVLPRIIYRTGSQKTADQRVIRWKTKYGVNAVIKERQYCENV